jgi:hypothetical protein
MKKILIWIKFFFLKDGASVENTLFEDGNGANTFNAFNPTQIFLNLKKKIVIDPLWSVDQYARYYIIT